MYYIHLASCVIGLRAEKLQQTICFVTSKNGSLSHRQSPLEQKSHPPSLSMAAACCAIACCASVPSGLSSNSLSSDACSSPPVSDYRESLRTSCSS